ncbi:hypothetical protein LARI1_G009225 [Lachnellula arida]|uniref:Uncharacterized protein n=1 Tax=Lachnellula arida TaxID=1316785 RepID=A0A8T9B3V0_9HELO|nr:hypothetical protein LARI1_G009225 [Lachnellula arida]
MERTYTELGGSKGYTSKPTLWPQIPVGGCNTFSKAFFSPRETFNRLGFSAGEPRIKPYTYIDQGFCLAAFSYAGRHYHT